MTNQFERKWFQKGTGEKPADFADGFFISEIESQCEFGLRAFGEMQQAYVNDNEHPSLMALAHVLLVFAGNVGKIISVSKDASVKSRNRAERLCKTLNLQKIDFEDVRNARNYFEHFDERIERYVGSHEGLLINRKILDHQPTTIEFDDGRVFAPAFLQFLNTTTLELTLYDQKFHISKIVKQLESIQVQAKEWREARNSPKT